MISDPDVEALLGPEAAPSDLISEAELADLLALTGRSIRGLVQQAVLDRPIDGRFRRREAVRAYVGHLGTLARRRGTSDPELRTEQIRLKREQADQLAVKNAAARRDLIPAAEVEREWSAILREVRAAVLATTSRIQARLPHLTVADVAALDSEIRDSLQAIANDEA